MFQVGVLIMTKSVALYLFFIIIFSYLATFNSICFAFLISIYFAGRWWLFNNLIKFVKLTIFLSALLDLSLIHTMVLLLNLDKLLLFWLRLAGWLSQVLFISWTDWRLADKLASSIKIQQLLSWAGYAWLTGLIRWCQMPLLLAGMHTLPNNRWLFLFLLNLCLCFMICLLGKMKWLNFRTYRSWLVVFHFYAVAPLNHRHDSVLYGNTITGLTLEKFFLDLLCADVGIMHTGILFDLFPTLLAH